MAKREYIQANKDWLEAKAKEEGVKALPKGIEHSRVSGVHLKGVPFSTLNLQAAYTNWFGIFASIACLARFSPNFCFALLKFSKIFITLHRVY